MKLLLLAAILAAVWVALPWVAIAWAGERRERVMV